jgi:hypothetical protein
MLQEIEVPRSIVVGAKEPVRQRLEPTTTYVAVDTEGLGDNMFKYPTIAVAFVAMDPRGNVLHKWQTYMPYEVDEKIIEPRCFKEFWNNPEKCKPEVYAALQEKCRKSPHKSVADGWQAVSDQIDEIYTKFSDNRVVWISDCPDYDVGRIEAYLAYYTQRPQGLRYNQKGERHSVKDCGSGRDILKRLFSDNYNQYKEAIQNTGVRHTHDAKYT